MPVVADGVCVCTGRSNESKKAYEVVTLPDAFRMSVWTTLARSVFNEYV
jgi:hypothetical protein